MTDQQHLSPAQRTAGTLHNPFVIDLMERAEEVTVQIRTRAHGTMQVTYEGDDLRVDFGVDTALPDYEPPKYGETRYRPTPPHSVAAALLIARPSTWTLRQDAAAVLAQLPHDERAEWRFRLVTEQDGPDVWNGPMEAGPAREVAASCLRIVRGAGRPGAWLEYEHRTALWADLPDGPARIHVTPWTTTKETP